MHIDLTASGDGQLDDGQTLESAHAEVTKLKDVTAQIEKIEAGLSKSLEKQEELERVRRIVSCLEEEKRVLLERSVEAMKNHLNCIICKNPAKFPWLVSRCCTVLMCQDCAEHWLRMESSCPHCRAVMTTDTCTTIDQIRAIQELISTLSSPEED